MKRFASTFVVLALLAAAGQAAQPDAENGADNLSPAQRLALAGQPIREVLDQPAQIEFSNTPLADVVRDLRNRCHIDVQLDLPALKEAGVDESTPVTFSSRFKARRPDGKEVKDMSLGTALHVLLDPMHLCYVIRNGGLLITGQPKAEQVIREALAQPTQIEFVDEPLKDVVEYLKDLHHIEIQLDGPALIEAGVEDATPVTKNLKGITLRSALHLMLDELSLKYVIHNEVLMITSRAKAESDEFLETRAYQVQDLVPPDHGAVDLQPLKDVLTATVAPKSWTNSDGSGGNGGIAGIVVGNRPLLIVRQTQDVHEQIQSTLDLLRKSGGLKDSDAANPKENVIHLKQRQDDR